MEKILEQLDPRLLGGRLQEARKSSGLTQQQVAEELGVARTTIVAIEKGERQISAHELIRFAELTRRKVSDFVSRKTLTESFVPQFRATHDYDEAIEEVGAELQRRAENFSQLETITAVTIPRIYPLVYETTGGAPEQIGEEIANAERYRLGFGDGPIGNLRDRLALQGLRIFYFEMPSNIAGVFAFNDVLGAAIGINSKHPRDRRTWSLAHEYGHFLTSRYQAEVTLLFEKRKLSARERLADSFAENFLMPASGLNQRITEMQRSLPDGITLAHIFELATTYQVSVQALIRRLEALKRLPFGTWDKLIHEGLKVRDAQRFLGIEVDTSIGESWPRQYITMAIFAFQKGLISEGELASYLRVDRLTAREEVDKFSTAFHSEEEHFAEYSSDLNRLLTRS